MKISKTLPGVKGARKLRTALAVWPLLAYRPQARLTGVLMSPSPLVSPLMPLLPVLSSTKNPFCGVFKAGFNVHGPIPKPPLSPLSHAA
jgi:hypothetical protein